MGTAGYAVLNCNMGGVMSNTGRKRDSSARMNLCKRG
jgi:hypothetical protein